MKKVIQRRKFSHILTCCICKRVVENPTSRQKHQFWDKRRGCRVYCEEKCDANLQQTCYNERDGTQG